MSGSRGKIPDYKEFSPRFTSETLNPQPQRPSSDVFRYQVLDSDMQATCSNIPRFSIVSVLAATSSSIHTAITARWGLLLEIAGNETALMRVTITVQASVANKSLQDMTLCKFNQRLQLSFSETRAGHLPVRATGRGLVGFGAWLGLSLLAQRKCGRRGEVGVEYLYVRRS